MVVDHELSHLLSVLLLALNLALLSLCYGIMPLHYPVVLHMKLGVAAPIVYIFLPQDLG